MPTHPKHKNPSVKNWYHAAKDGFVVSATCCDENAQALMTSDFLVGASKELTGALMRRLFQKFMDEHPPISETLWRLAQGEQGMGSTVIHSDQMLNPISIQSAWEWSSNVGVDIDAVKDWINEPLITEGELDAIKVFNEGNWTQVGWSTSFNFTGDELFEVEKDKWYAYNGKHWTVGGMITDPEPKGVGRSEEVNALPGVRTRVKNPEDGSMDSIEDIIIELNDDYKWTREQIADWLETLDVDLRFSSRKEESLEHSS